MGALDPAKILVILVVALIVLGPERLPRFAREIGGVWRELTRIREQVVSEVRDAMPEELRQGNLIPRIPHPVPGSVSGFVSGLMAPAPGAAGGREISASEALAPADDAADAIPRTDPERRGRADEVSLGALVMHPAFGDHRILPDDPSMN